jgi:hypothetical protein
MLNGLRYYERSIRDEINKRIEKKVGILLVKIKKNLYFKYINTSVI